MSSSAVHNCHFTRLVAYAQEVRQLQSLLELLEEDFDLPAAAAEIADGSRAPLEIIDQDLFPSV